MIAYHPRGSQGKTPGTRILECPSIPVPNSREYPGIFSPKVSDTRFVTDAVTVQVKPLVGVPSAINSVYQRHELYNAVSQ